MNLPPIEHDPRFREAVDLFNRRDYLEAGDLFEELFFEATGAELEFARAFLQASVGLLHAERRQSRAAIGRLEEAILAIGRVGDSRGVDLTTFSARIEAVIASLRSGASFEWPVLTFI